MHIVQLTSSRSPRNGYSAKICLTGLMLVNMSFLRISKDNLIASVTTNLLGWTYKLKSITYCVTVTVLCN